MLVLAVQVTTLPSAGVQARDGSAQVAALQLAEALYTVRPSSAPVSTPGRVALGGRYRCHSEDALHRALCGETGCCALQVGGATLGLQVRAQLDSMVTHQAASAAAAVQRTSAAGLDASFGSALPLQLAALRALRASVLAPCSHRPPFLPRALALLRQVSMEPNAYLRSRNSDWPCARLACHVA